MAVIGGLKASIMPIIGYLAPLLCLHFLISLAAIIVEKMNDNQRKEHLELL